MYDDDEEEKRERKVVVNELFVIITCSGIMTKHKSGDKKKATKVRTRQHHLKKTKTRISEYLQCPSCLLWHGF